MKLILHQVRFDKLLPVLSHVKLENPEFKSQNPKNSEKILEKCKKSSENSKNPENIGKILKSPEKLSESERSGNTGYFLLQNFWNVGFYKLTPLPMPPVFGCS